jgi:hypothetical protein
MLLNKEDKIKWGDINLVNKKKNKPKKKEE